MVRRVLMVLSWVLGVLMVLRALCSSSRICTVLFGAQSLSVRPCSEYSAFITASVSSSRKRQHTALVSTTSEPGRWKLMNRFLNANTSSVVLTLQSIDEATNPNELNSNV